MFIPERMREVNFFIREEDIQATTTALARLGALHLEAGAEPATAHVAHERWQALAGSYAAAEHRLADLLETLHVPLRPAALLDDLAMHEALVQITATADQAEQALCGWRDDQMDAHHESEHLRLVMKQVQLLAPLDVAVDSLAGLGNLHLTVGNMPALNLARLQTSLFRIPFVIIPAYEFDGETLVFAATTHENAPILDRALHSAFFEPLTVPEDVSGLPQRALAVLEQHQADLQTRLNDLEHQRSRLVQQWAGRLTAAWNRARACRALADVIKEFSLHGEIYLIAGWTPVVQLQKVIDVVQQATAGRAVIQVLEPDSAAARAPTLLHNPAWLRPFESLVSNFGFPAYNEIDPTLILALSFLFMYGMMFGDMGHGALLALAGLWLRQRQSTLTSFGPILVLAGLCAAGFGLVYGSVFGIALFEPLWIRPLDSIMDLLLAAVVAGVVLLNVGFGLNLLIAWRARDWSRLLLSKNGLAGVWLYWALLGGGVAIWLGAALPTWLWLLLMVIPALLLTLQEPLMQWVLRRRPLVAGSWGEFAVLAFAELFETVLGFISNTLSFVRLGAFAVAHEGLSLVIMLLAGLSGGLGWLVILLGTLLIVGFEGLIVGIQTLRLEYYEFFGKFFGGAGRPFNPLRLLLADKGLAAMNRRHVG